MTLSRADVEALARRRDAPRYPGTQVPKRVAPTRKEREIQRAILEASRLWKGVTLWRTNVGAVKDGTRFVRFGFPGLSDLIGWKVERRDGITPVVVARFVAIEVKRPGTFPTREQVAFLESVTAAGGLAFVARSVEDVRIELGL